MDLVGIIPRQQELAFLLSGWNEKKKDGRQYGNGRVLNIRRIREHTRPAWQGERPKINIFPKDP